MPGSLGWRTVKSLVRARMWPWRPEKLARWALVTGGWRNERQTPRSQVPQEGIRRKAPPDTEGIETRHHGDESGSSTIVAKPRPTPRA